VKIVEYKTAGGKNLIEDYVSQLSNKDQLEYELTKKVLLRDGFPALKDLNTRQLRGKLWEIKFSQNRIMYVVQSGDAVYFLHACKKQKGKAEKMDIELAVQRAKEHELKI